MVFGSKVFLLLIFLTTLDKFQALPVEDVDDDDDYENYDDNDDDDYIGGDGGKITNIYETTTTKKTTQKATLNDHEQSWTWNPKRHQVETDVNNWHVDSDDFTCFLPNQSFVILDIFRLCDGVEDCRSGSDESETICLIFEKCPLGKRKCPLENLCIEQQQLCDGSIDCTADSWDERQAAGCETDPQKVPTDVVKSLVSCPEGTFLCAADFKCLDETLLCNFLK